MMDLLGTRVPKIKKNFFLAVDLLFFITPLTFPGSHIPIFPFISLKHESRTILVYLVLITMKHMVFLLY